MKIIPTNNYNVQYYSNSSLQNKQSYNVLPFKSTKIIDSFVTTRQNPIKKYAYNMFKRSLVASARMISPITPELQPITREIPLQISPTKHTFAWDIQNNNSNKYLIYLHGASQNITNIQNLYRQIIDNTDFSILAPEYQGFGKNKKCKVNSQTFLEDTTAALNYLKQEKNIEEKNIFIAGHSMGAYPAAMLASNNPKLGGLILISPMGSITNQPLDVNFWFAKRMPPFVKFLFKNFKILRTSLSDFFQIETFVRQIQIPTDIIHAQNDRLIKPSSSEKLASLCPNLNSLTILKQGGHKIEKYKSNAIISLLSRY